MLEIKTMSLEDFTRMRNNANKTLSTSANGTPKPQKAVGNHTNVSKMVFTRMGREHHTISKKKEIIVHTTTLEEFKKAFPINYVITLPKSPIKELQNSTISR